MVIHIVFYTNLDKQVYDDYYMYLWHALMLFRFALVALKDPLELMYTISAIFISWIPTVIESAF